MFASSSAGLGVTVCQSTSWASDTSAACLAGGTLVGGGSGRVAITAGRVRRTATSLWSIDRATISSMTVTNQPVSAVGTVASLAGLGMMSSSPTARAGAAGASSCESSVWKSDSSVVCQAAHSMVTGGGSRLVVVTSGMRSGTQSGGLSFDAVRLSQSQAVNVAAIGSLGLSAVGASMGLSGGSSGGRRGGSACEASTWLSDSGVVCISARSSGGSLRSVVTAGLGVGSVSFASSADIPSISSVSPTNAPLTGVGAPSLTIAGRLFGTQATVAARTGSASSCVATSWISMTSVSCVGFFSNAYRGSLGFSITASVRLGSITGLFSVDSGRLSTSLASNVVVGDSTSQLTLFGTGLGNTAFSSTTSTTGSVCPSTRWISATSLQAKPAPLGSGRTLRVMATVGSRVGTESCVLTTDFIYVSAPSDGNVPHLSSFTLSLVGSGGGATGWSQSPSSRVGASSMTSTSWISQTTVLCRPQSFTGGLARSLALMVSSGLIVRSSTSAASYDVAVVTSTNGNTPSTGGSLASLSGSGLGTASGSPTGRAGGTTATSSVWASQTSVSCLISMGIGSGLTVVVTAGSGKLSTGASKLVALTYDSPAASSASGSSWSLTGAWCSLPGSTCVCQGLAVMARMDLSSNTAGSSSFASTQLVDTSGSIACSGSQFNTVSGGSQSSIVACYCVNQPYTSGPSVTLTGTGFGPVDSTVVARLLPTGTTAPPIRWISQTAVTCRLPTCTDCSLTTGTLSMSLVIGAISSSLTFSSSVGSSISVSSNQACPQFWVTSGTFSLTSTLSGSVLCRREYTANENIKWILSSCADASSCETISTISSSNSATQGIAVRSLPAVTFSLARFNTGTSGTMAIDSCSDSNCATVWSRQTGLTGSISSPPSVQGNPYLRVSWTSTAAGTGLGWDGTWVASSTGRVFRLFQSGTALNWADSSSACSALTVDGGGYKLASVATANEFSAISALLNSASSDAWIGLQSVSGSWTWADGSPYSYTQWASGNPASNQFCAVASKSNSGSWVSATCSSTTSFYVCSLK
mmetsp:Transcript_18439/g.50886  ORF Transcript_18439/g.50886 Transcript_18439/m.50886 type:complete len:1038 (+) Transcript_18439:1-3114(+)